MTHRGEPEFPACRHADSPIGETGMKNQTTEGSLSASVVQSGRYSVVLQLSYSVVLRLFFS
jgi:hypothetical protein